MNPSAHTPHPPVTLRTALCTLAYVQHYTIPYVAGRAMPVAHLRRLASWLGYQEKALLTLRAHRPLAAHLILLQAADLLAHTAQHWYCQPAVYAWLKATPAVQTAVLLQAIDDCQFTTRAEQADLSVLLDLPYTQFIRQGLDRLVRQTISYAVPSPMKITLLADSLTFWLPPTLPDVPRFHLLQLGNWQPPNGPLEMTPLTFAEALQQGYSLATIEYLLAEAAGQPLSPELKHLLLAWERRSQAMQIQTVTLLSTKQPEQLTAVYQRRTLKRHIHQQLSPRHAIVSPTLIAPLKKWLAEQKIPLHIPEPHSSAREIALSESAYVCIGLRLLVDLHSLMPLPLPAPHTLLAEATATLTPAQQVETEQLAQKVMHQVREVIHGRDAFFPAQTAVPSTWPVLIRQAIDEEQPLTITYRALGDSKASDRTIYPFRLEERGALSYLTAYCTRAETNLIFRLDRISHIGKPLDSDCAQLSTP